MKKGKVNILIDGQWGSTGKGKIAGYLAKAHSLQIVAAQTSPNAGHTFVDGDTEYMFKQLPIAAAINTDAKVLITPHCVINPDRLLLEAEMAGCLNRLFVHPNACVVTDEHREKERNSLNSISSTLQGTGAALTSRIMREASAVAKNCEKLHPYIADTSAMMNFAISSGQTCFLEVSQGFDLSLTHGNDYPYVTSRDITTCSALNSAGVSPYACGDVYGSIRTFPIRVGNAYDADGKEIGWSGPCYSDHGEVSWEWITKNCGSPAPILERTTVTKKIRRIFTFSNKQLVKFINQCGCTRLFVNFANYWDHADYGKTSWSDLTLGTKEKIKALQSFIDAAVNPGLGIPIPRISHIGTGPDDSHLVEL